MKAIFDLKDKTTLLAMPRHVVEVYVRDTTGLLEIRPEGTGDFSSEPGKGFPIVLEMYEGKLRLVVWGDINQEDPTHVIDLSKAFESERLPDSLLDVSLPCGHMPEVDEEYACKQFGEGWTSVLDEELTYYCEECDQPYIWQDGKWIPC